MTTVKKDAASPEPIPTRLLAGLFGACFGLVLVKLGNPVIFDAQIKPPKELLEILLMSWPINWGYGLLALLVLAGMVWRLTLPPADQQSKTAAARPGPTDRAAPSRNCSFRWLVFLPLVWLIWQGLAATRTVDSRLTSLVLPHFAACVVCFYLGLLVVSRFRAMQLFWITLLLGFAFVLWQGFEQQLGGLEETRRRFEQLPPEMRAQFDLPGLKDRMASNRIFSTFVYPNAFAGAILLLLPPAISAIVSRQPQVSALARRLVTYTALVVWFCYLFLYGWQVGWVNSLVLTLFVFTPSIILYGRHWLAAGMAALAGLACLYWSGSKAGWLIALILTLLFILYGVANRRIKFFCLLGLLLAGLAGFFVKHGAYFEKGASSMGARLDYWRAALQVARANPVFGTGPGTFSVLYGRLKATEDEMAKLAHNDYLEQASDSGVIGFVTYLLLMAGTLVYLQQRARAAGGVLFAVWLGLVGWAIQGTVEFGLYIPALAWPAFLLLGWLWGCSRAHLLFVAKLS